MSSQNIHGPDEILSNRESKASGSNQAESVEAFIHDVSYPKLEEYPAETFTYDGRIFRYCHDKAGKEWFCAADICHYLGHEDVPKQLTKYGVFGRKRLFNLSGQKLPCVSKSDLKEMLEKSQTAHAEKLLISIYDHELPFTFDHSRQSQPQGPVPKKIGQDENLQAPNMDDQAKVHLSLGVPVVEEIEASMFERNKGISLPVDILAPTKKLIGGRPTWTINGWNLYQFLHPDKDYPKWINSLIRTYGYLKDKDFIGFPETRNLFLTLPMAREISMTCPNQEGRQARFYLVAFGNKHPEDQAGSAESAISLAGSETANVTETDQKEDRVGEETESSDQEAQTEENPVEEEQAEEDYSVEEQLDEIFAVEEQQSEENPAEEEASDEISAEEEPSDEIPEEEEPEEYFELAEAARLLGVGIQFLHRYMDDIGWLMPQTDEPKVWTVHQGLMIYDLDQPSENGTPGLLTSEGFDVLESNLIKLGVITPITSFSD